jgi:hypothetical protein
VSTVVPAPPATETESRALEALAPGALVHIAGDDAAGGDRGVERDAAGGEARGVGAHHAGARGLDVVGRGVGERDRAVGDLGRHAVGVERAAEVGPGEARDANRAASEEARRRDGGEVLVGGGGLLRLRLEEICVRVVPMVLP